MYTIIIFLYKLADRTQEMCSLSLYLPSISGECVTLVENQLLQVEDWVEEADNDGIDFRELSYG